MIAKSAPSRLNPIYFEAVEYKSHPDFRKPKCIKAILGPMPDYEAYEIERKKIRSQVDGITLHVRATYDEPILNKAQEVYLFKKYNYIKYLAAQIQKGFKTDFRVHRRRKFCRLLRQAHQIQNHIAAANYRLAVSIVGKLRNNYATDEELVNEAYMRIWLVVPKFDLKFGWKFSTYATYAVTNNLTQKYRMEHKFQTRYTTNNLDEPDRVQNDDFIEEVADAEIAAKNKMIVKVAMRVLRKMEQSPAGKKQAHVIKQYFGLAGYEEKILREIGQDMGVTVERIRQIRGEGLERLKEELLAKGLYI